MPNKPIKLQDNFYLYSGDVITINNSSPLLVEVENAENQTIKLRDIKDNKYLSKNKNLLSKFKKPLDFSTYFENALIFTAESNDYKISLQVKNKYLEPNNENFHLSSEEKRLTITKQQNTKDIANFEETVKNIKVYKEKSEEISTEKRLIVRDSHDNKSANASKHTFNFTESKQKEYSLTQSSDFTWEVSANLKLTCSSIVGLEIGGRFEEKSSTSKITKMTNNEIIQKSLEVTCSPWKKMRVVSEIKKTNRRIPYEASVKREISGRIYEYSINGECFCEESLCHNSFNEEITVRNILIVGWTGSGKSTLAKVLSGDDKFEEGSGSVSKTKSFQKSEEFEQKGNYYCVIDNIGFGDTEVDDKQVLIRIGGAINSAYQGLSHVLFVFDGKLSDKEREGFQKLAALKITNSFITLVRSNFSNFGSKGECDKDKELLKNESVEISQLLDNCRSLLHIDNDDEDTRKKSREKVLDYLHNNCIDEPFKPKEWENISVLIEDYYRKKIKLEKEKNQVDDTKKEAIEHQLNDLKNTTADQVKEEVKGEEIHEFIEVIEVVKNK